jgi:argininosuccinate lyase
VYKYAMQLLELEQKFESYCAINEEELKQIKMTLEQLREDILSGNQDYSTITNETHLVVDSLSDSSGNSGEKDET